MVRGLRFTKCVNALTVNEVDHIFYAQRQLEPASLIDAGFGDVVKELMGDF